MEMHQVRYFLAVARLLNFTRAAEECHVAQPSLTRAIKQLEDELGGELFRRERNFTHLTDLGHRMLPMLQQCYESALSAKSLAHSIKAGAVMPLSIGVSLALSTTLIQDFIAELLRAFPGLELRLLRGTGHELAEHMKKGAVDVAIAGPLEETWDRLESWALFQEPLKLVVSRNNPLAERNSVPPCDLDHERLLFRTHCEHMAEVAAFFASHASEVTKQSSVGSDLDALALIASHCGVAIMPLSSARSGAVVCLDLEGLRLERKVSVYAVAGRQRTTAATTLIRMLRAADWKSLTGQDA